MEVAEVGTIFFWWCEEFLQFSRCFVAARGRSGFWLWNINRALRRGDAGEQNEKSDSLKLFKLHVRCGRAHAGSLGRRCGIVMQNGGVEALLSNHGGFKKERGRGVQCHGFATHHPGGMDDNSPTFQRWDLNRQW